MLKKCGFLFLLLCQCFAMEGNEQFEVNPVGFFSRKENKSHSTKSVREKEEKKSYDFVNDPFYIEVLPGYYYPTSSRVRRILGNGGFKGQLEIGHFFYKKLALFLRGGAYWDSGKSTSSRTKTSVVLGNVTFGLKYVFPILDCFHYYLGVGPRIFFLRIKNGNEFVKKRVSANRLGGAVHTGFWIYPFKYHPLFLDVFLDYSIYKFRFDPSIASKRSSLNVSGPTVGIGLGYQF